MDRDTTAFIEGVLDVKLENWQIEFLKAIERGAKLKIIVGRKH